MLVNLEDAIAHLRMEPGVDDTGVMSKLAEAEDWAKDIIGANFDDGWTAETVPGRVRSAILAYLSSVYDHDMDGKWLDIANRLIERWRDHVLE